MTEKKKILIVDDEPEVVQLCTVILEKANYLVISESNGNHIIDRLKTEKPDLFVLDIMLPGIDGYTLQLQISQDPNLSQIPVVVISALKQAEKLFSSFKQVKSFISKPFLADEFLNAVKLALESPLNP